MSKLTLTSKILTLLGLICACKTAEIQAVRDEKMKDEKKEEKAKITASKAEKKAEEKIDKQEKAPETQSKSEAKNTEAEKGKNAIDQSKEALTNFMRVQMPKKDASDADKVPALSQKMDHTLKLLPLLDEWKKRVADSKALSDADKKEFDSNVSKITKEAIQAAIDDLKAAKPNLTKAEAMRVNVTTCHRMVEKSKAGSPEPVKVATTTTSSTATTSTATSTAAASTTTAPVVSTPLASTPVVSETAAPTTTTSTVSAPATSVAQSTSSTTATTTADASAPATTDSTETSSSSDSATA